MTQGASHSQFENGGSQSIAPMLGGLRDSLDQGRRVSEKLATALLRVSRRASTVTIDNVLPETDPDDAPPLDEAQDQGAVLPTLQRLLHDRRKFDQLAEAINRPECTAVRELLASTMSRLIQQSLDAAVGCKEDSEVTVTHVHRDGEGSFRDQVSDVDLMTSPSSHSQSLRNDETSSHRGEVQIGSLERAFEILVDKNGNPISLGKGGMGYVMAGTLLDGGTESALKICGDPAHEPRMMREYEVLKKLAVEGFPLVGGIYRNARGQLCYSMKLVRGVSYASGYEAFHAVANNPKCTEEKTIRFLREFLLVERPADGFRQPDVSQIFNGVLECLIDVATGVSTMHGEGFIHRDLKPENVRIEGKTRRAVILDLGLAKIQEQPDIAADTHEFLVNGERSSDLTRHGCVMGTLAYMAPEQASGDSTTHTKAIDIYALGAMLYYLMTGKNAISLSDPPLKILERIKNADFDPPVRLPVIRADFPDLEAICSKAMATDPDKRYASADKMIIDLRAWIAGSRVKAYEEQLSSGGQTWERWRYHFHHWKKQNTGPWNRIVTGALAVFTAGGGLLAYFGNESAKADRAAVSAEKSLSGITEEVDKRVREFLGANTIQTLSVAELDDLARGGKFELFLDDQRKRLAKEILQPTDGGVANFTRYSVARNIMSQASKADEELERIGSVFKERVTNRAQMRQELEAFRKEFAPIRDFLGNDFDNFMVDVSHERIDSALARYLPAFRAAPQVRAADQVRKPFFPECSKEVDQWVLSSENQELTSSERQELMHGIATLLSYKVLNLQRSPVVGYPRPIEDVLPMCSAYLEEARKLKGGEASPLDSVLLWRVAAALKEPRAVQLRETVDAAVNRALNDQTYAKQLSSQDLGILAKQLVEEYRYAEAQNLFDVMLANADMVGGDQTALSASRYFGEYGKAYCLFFLAKADSGANFKDSPEVANYLDEATYAFHRARAHLSELPRNTADRGTREANVYLTLARVETFRYRVSQDPRHLANVKVLHASARDASSGPRLAVLIGVDLLEVGDYNGAADEWSKALESAPYFSSELRSQRAQCYAMLGQEDKMLQDVEMVLKSAQSSDTASTVEPKNLSKCTLALAVYMWGQEKDWPSARRDEYLELMRTLLREVQKRCSSGFPYAVEQLDLETDYFNVLKTYDSVFWDDYVRTVSAGVVGGAKLP